MGHAVYPHMRSTPCPSPRLCLIWEIMGVLSMPGLSNACLVPTGDRWCSVPPRHEHWRADVISLEAIQTARHRIEPHVRRTPTLRASALKQALPWANVTMKLECLQVTGSFKARGAMNRVLGATADDLRAGLVTASGGNHGLA